jgi:CRISPR-associated protein Csb1
MNYEKIENENRLLIEARLRPIQGTRFQPTGFPNLGSADYVTSDGIHMLLVESPQSLANRMEKVCWDEASNELVPPLRGIPYIRVKNPEGDLLTTSIDEAHRLNSPYILEGKNKDFFNRLKKDLEAGEKGKPDYRLMAKILFRYDINSLIHGVFLAKKELANGRLRVARSLSAFVEARNVTVATSGGVKRDDLDVKGDAKKGFGHVPFSREEYTGEITAYFNLDLAQIRGYGLGRDAEELLVTMSLYKINKFLDEGLRFRTACDLELVDMIAKRPHDYEIPTLADLGQSLPSLISRVKDKFADPPITEVVYEA